MKKGVLKLLLMGISYTFVGFFFQLLFINLLWATEIKGQEIKDIKDVVINVEIQDKSLKETFKILEELTTFHFAYDKRDNFLSDKFTLEKQTISIEDILIKIATDSRLKFKQVNNNITVSKHLSSKNTPFGNVEEDIEISGKVIETSGAPIPGVTITVAGTITGTVTNAEGEYSLTIPEGATLQFSFIGFLSQSIVVGDKSIINVTLSEDTTSLDEVVVVGYGTQKKVNLTGAVSTIGSEKIGSRPIVQTSTVLQGLAPGVTVTQNLGTPGNDASTIRIRGQGSISSNNSPLILVDGIQVGSINEVNPEDIETISVLKDAASASIYGSRAANGVILITTKRGEIGKFTVNADFSYGGQIPTMLPNFVDVKQQMMLEDVKRVNEGLLPEWSTGFINDYTDYLSSNAPNDQYQYNDWYKAMVSNSAPMHRENIVVSGGSEKIQARLSMVNMDQGGLTENSTFNRRSFRSNVDLVPLDWLRFSTDIFIQRSEKTQPSTAISTLFQQVNELEPYRQLKVGDDLWGFAWNGNNPVASARDGGTQKADDDYTLINLNAILTPLEGLSIDLGYSSLKDNTQTNRFSEIFSYYTAGANVGDAPSLSGTTPANNFMLLQNQTDLQNNYKAVASYERDLGDHSFKVLVGGDAIDFQTTSFYGSRSNFPLGISYRQLSLGSVEGMSNGSSGSKWSMASLLSRVNYIYKSRYLLEASFRYDGSSRFAEDKRWGFFPSVSAGWRIIEEKFMQDASFFTDLKLRASWGRLGNQNIGSNYPYQSLVDLTLPIFIRGEANPASAAITQWAERGISWELSEQTDLGIDFGILDNKLTGSFDYYVKNNSNILLILALPGSSGLAANYQNGAEMRNSGWELALNWEDNIGDWNYYMGVNFDDNNNEVMNLLGTGPYISNNRIRVEGEAFDALYGWESIGFLTKEDLEDPSVPKQVAARLAEGSLKFKDQDGNGVIDANDRKIIGSELPRYNYSVSTGLNYKGIALDILLQGVLKRDGYMRRIRQSYGDHLYDWESDFYIPADHKIFTVYNYDELGLEPNTDANQPAMGADNGNFSDFWIRSRAYLRVKNITLSYTLPKSILQPLKIQNVRVYVSGENLYTFHNYIKGFDPELGNNEGYWEYPNVMKIIGGLNLTF